MQNVQMKILSGLNVSFFPFTRCTKAGTGRRSTQSQRPTPRRATSSTQRNPDSLLLSPQCVQVEDTGKTVLSCACVQTTGPAILRMALASVSQDGSAKIAHKVRETCNLFRFHTIAAIFF